MNSSISRDDVYIILILLLAFLLRFYGLGLMPIFHDEAYYYVWADHIQPGNLELSFYDHPPGLAYVLKLSVLFFGDSVFGVRALFTVIGVANIYLIYVLGRYLFDRKVGLIASFLLAINFGHIIFSRLAMSDSPAFFLYTLLIYFFARTMFEDSRKYMLLTGLTFGIAFDMKYTLITIGAGFFLFVMLESKYRKWLFDRYTYIAALLAFIMVTPVLVWNIQHGWASIIYQSAHASPFQATFLQNRENILLSIIVDLMYYPFGWLLLFSIPLTILLFTSVFDGFRKRNKETTLLLLSFFSMFLFFSFSAGKMFHWALPVIVPLSLLCARMLIRLYNWVSLHGWLSKLYILFLCYVLITTSVYSAFSVQCMTGDISKIPDPKSPLIPSLVFSISTSEPFADSLKNQLEEYDPEVILVPNWVTYSPVAYYVREWTNRTYTFHWDYQIGKVWRRDLRFLDEDISEAIVAIYTSFNMDVEDVILNIFLFYWPDQNNWTVYNRTGLDEFILLDRPTIEYNYTYKGNMITNSIKPYAIILARHTGSNKVTLTIGNNTYWAYKSDIADGTLPLEEIIHINS